MVQGRTPLTGSLAAVLVAALALEGCVTYPTAVPTREQDAATAERDEKECRARAADEVENPLTVGLGTKLLWALGGAVLGAGFVVSLGADNNSSSGDPRWVFVAIGGGAAVGFVVGSIAGTFKGGDDASRAARARERAFANCMSERGYRLEL